MSKVQHLLPYKGYMTTFDLKSGYHHVRIAEQSQRYLGFKWKNTLYKFTVLPFGLSSAPHIFTKILRPLIKKWRAEGKGVALYLDDGLIWASSRAECSAVSQDIRKDLKKFGWFDAKDKSQPLIKKWRAEGKGVALYLDDEFIWASSRAECSAKDTKKFGWFGAKDKSQWNPSAKTKWLGFEIDLNKFEISISRDRIERANAILCRMLREKAPSLLLRMRWEGSLASMSLVISDKDRRRTRAITTAIAKAQSSEFSLNYRWSLLALERRDLYFRMERLKLGVSTSLFPPDSPPTPRHILEVGASVHSVGAVLVGDRNVKAHNVLPESLRTESSTSRE
ncbi:unnamed protein product, partial [Haemonchus placei]|uniref:Reverse transcriptase domain-containing protein n=1 Tax=Haemonchus placei TaxID=6290 RepID=A0A0N4XC39_HAEPC